MKLIIDVSYYNNISPAQYDLLATVLDGVVIRLSFGDDIDVMAQYHVDQCNRVNLPYAGYHWVDPTVQMSRQKDTWLSAVRLFKPKGMFNDYEQYWTDWAAYMRQDLTEAYRTKFTPQQLDNYYRTFHNWCVDNNHVPIGQYSADWFMSKYCPAMVNWATVTNYWEARYLRYTDSAYVDAKIALWGDPFDISHVSELAEYALQNSPGIGRQFESYLEVKGLYDNIRYHLDWNAFTDDGFVRMFTMKELDVTFISQLGEGANAYNNDCGLACCSMVVNAVKDIVVKPDDWYLMDGWKISNNDVGTYAYQLVKALDLFDINSTLQSTITINIIRQAIDSGQLIIPLVVYTLFANAGLTQFPGNFNHWFVIIGYDDSNIIVLDPYRTDSGRVLIPNQMLINSYMGNAVFVLDSILEGVSPMATNASVNAPNGLNVRSNHPDANGTYASVVGSLAHLRRITIDMTSFFTDNKGFRWAQLLDVYPGSWIRIDLINIDPVAPPPPGAPDEKAIRLDEIKKAIAYLNGRKTTLGG